MSQNRRSAVIQPSRGRSNSLIEILHGFTTSGIRVTTLGQTADISTYLHGTIWIRRGLAPFRRSQRTRTGPADRVTSAQTTTNHNTISSSTQPLHHAP